MGLLGALIDGVAGVPAAVRVSVDRQPAAAAVRDPADLHRRAAGHARAAGGTAVADLSRVAEQADLRHPGSPGSDRRTTERTARAHPGMRHTPIRCAARAVALTSMLLAAACGGSSTAPSPPPTGPVVSSISPNSGPSIGGTAVTINGQRFDATRNGHDRWRRGDERHLRQRQRADGDDRITQHRAGRRRGDRRGAARSAGRMGSPTRSSGAVTNAPPVISSLTAVGSAPNQPRGVRRLQRGDTVTAVVTDAETADTAPDVRVDG